LKPIQIKKTAKACNALINWFLFFICNY